MKINQNIGITPEHYSDMKQSEFLMKFKGKASVKKLKEIHKECVKLKKLKP
jgi:hypothetical protein